MKLNDDVIGRQYDNTQKLLKKCKTPQPISMFDGFDREFFIYDGSTGEMPGKNPSIWMRVKVVTPSPAMFDLKVVGKTVQWMGEI